MVQDSSRAAFPGGFFALNLLLLLAVGAYIGRDTLLPPEHPGVLPGPAVPEAERLVETR